MCVWIWWWWWWWWWISSSHQITMFPEACLGHVCLRLVGVCRISQYVPSQYWHLLTFWTFTAGSSKNRTRLSKCRAPTFQVVYKQVAQLYQCYTYIIVKQLSIFIYTYTWKISYIVTPDKQLQLVQVIDYVKIDPLFMGTFRISQSPNRRLKQRDLENDENVFVNGWAWDQYTYLNGYTLDLLSYSILLGILF
jgi:hypothetical protein